MATTPEETRDTHPRVSAIQLDPATLETIISGVTAQLRATTGGGGERASAREEPPAPTERGKLSWF